MAQLVEPKTKTYRWTVVVLLFFATTINYLDRQVIGLLKPALAADLHWNESDYAHIVMAFTASYALGYVIFGRIIDKIGTKLGLSLSLVIWSLAAMGHALAKSTMGFAFWRATLGLGEAGNFPASIKAIAEWFPKRERAFATGLFNSGTNIGAVVAPIMVPWILGAYGWQEAFVITGAIGFIWLIFWWIFYEIPTRKKGISQAELELINSDADDDSEEKPIPWLQLFRVRQTWAYVFGKFLTDPIWWFFLFWLPSYFAQIFDLDLTKPSLPLVVVYSASTVGSIGGGYLSGWLIKKGWPVFKARKSAMLLYAFLVVPIVFATYATNIWMAVAFISLACAAHQAWSANIFTTASDMFPRRAVSSIVGIGGMAGSLGGVLFPFIVGQILDTFSARGDITSGYNIIFIMCGSAYLIAWVVMHLFVPRMERVKV